MIETNMKLQREKTNLNTPGPTATAAIMHVSAVEQFIFIIHITNVIIFLSKHQQQQQQRCLSILIV